MERIYKDNKLEIERLQKLLKERQEEYKVFGRTPEDITQDNKIVEEIELLTPIDK